jgi:hypothetical protein
LLPPLKEFESLLDWGRSASKEQIGQVRMTSGNDIIEFDDDDA